MPAKTERFELRLDEDLLNRLDGWAAEQPERLTRAEAIRQLVDRGLAAQSRRSVKFSDGEKMLMLMMQDVMKALKIKDPNVDANFLAEVIYGGHYWAPKWKMQGVFHDHVDSDNDVKHVVDVLDMWSFMEEAYEGLTAAQKKTISGEVGPWAATVTFPGFDGNNESSQMSIASFLVNDMDRFTRFKGRDLNSHSPTYGRYSRMLMLFEPMRKKLIGHRLDVPQLVALLKV